MMAQVPAQISEINANFALCMLNVNLTVCMLNINGTVVC